MQKHIIENFGVVEQQPFAWKKFVDHAGTELETEAVLLYQAVRTLIELRKNTNDTFSSCEQLAKLVFDNYISGNRNTLTVYSLRYMVQEIKSPVELLEKETTVLVPLKEQLREKVLLPMFARMNKKNQFFR
jgi:hypothetical protein